MSDIIDKVWQLAVESMDILLVIALVCAVQGAKRALPRMPSKAWMMVNLAAGLLLAWIKVPAMETGYGREFARQAIIYAAGAELCYQGWRTLAEAARSRLGKGKG